MAVDSRGFSWRQATVAVLLGAFLFNLGQGILRPTLPLYLQQTFSASYGMVTAIATVFGVGKWMASLPTGYLLPRLARSLMVGGLLLIAFSDLASVMTSSYVVFLGFRALGGVGWAMFGTVATTMMVDVQAAQRRGRAISLLLMSETFGLLLGSAASGWLYRSAGVASPFLFEAGCMLVAGVAMAASAVRTDDSTSAVPGGARDRPRLRSVLEIPGVRLMGLTSAILIALQTGVLVFLFPLFLVNRRSASPETVGLLVSVMVLGRLVSVWLGGSLSDRAGRMRVLVPGLVAYAVLLAILTFATHPVVLGLWSFAVGGATGFVAGIPTALVGDQVPVAVRGVAIGWLRTMTDTGQIVGPLLMGTLADAVDLSAPFMLGAAALLATAWRCRRVAPAIPRATA
jgi:MFS family permease